MELRLLDTNIQQYPELVSLYESLLAPLKAYFQSEDSRGYQEAKGAVDAIMRGIMSSHLVTAEA